jgi:aryl carrier-like protein
MTLMAAGEEQRRTILETYLIDLTSRVLGFPASELDVGQPLTSLGLDSLLALELRNALERDLGVSVSLRMFFDAPTLAVLAKQLDNLAWIQQGNELPVSEGTEDREHFEL